MTHNLTPEKPKLMKRRRIRVGELIEICLRQSTSMYHHACDKARMNYDELVKYLKLEGNCECGCEKPLNGEGEFDHITENALLFDGDDTDWQILLPACHRKKTSARAPILAKVRRVSRKHGIDRAHNPITRKKKTIPSPANPWPKGQKIPSKKTVYRPNVKEID